MQWNKVALIGVGLLGGSLGLALRTRRLANCVAGFVRRRASVGECVQRGAVDIATLDLEQAVSGAELIVLCTPLGQMRPLLERMLPFVRRRTILTDVGSVKACLVRELQPLAAKEGVHFVGSHPMAGAEQMGVSAARSDLFADAVCVVTPTPQSNRAAVRRVERLWKSVGARVLRLSPADHDRMVCRTSHLPHLVATQLAHLVLEPRHPPRQACLCANGFRDTTRIAASSPEMWRDIALANRANLGRELARYIRDLGKVQDWIRRGDQRRIELFLTEAKARRDRWQEVSAAWRGPGPI